MQTLWQGKLSFSVKYPDNVKEDDVNNDVNFTTEGQKLLWSDYDSDNISDVINAIHKLAKQRGGTVIWQIESL